MTSRPHRQIRRELENELRDEAKLPTTPPPADLLAKIRAEIPADLRAANNEEEAPAPRRNFLGSPGFRLAASVAVAVVGVALGYRALERSEERNASLASIPEATAASSKGARMETVEVDAFDAMPNDKDEKPPLKGKTKDVGDDAAAEWKGRAQLTDSSTGRRAEAEPELLRIAKVAPGEAKRPAAQSAPSASAPPPASASEESRRDSDAARLQALGYVGGTAATPAPRASAAPIQEFLANEVAPSAIDSRKVAAGATADVAAASAPARARQSPRPETAPEKLSALGYLSGTSSPSTGGAKEPNEQVAGDMFFRPVETNPFVDSAEDRLSTFALDVDTGSWTLARSYLERGALPPREAIRVEEFVNAQPYDDPAPRRGDFTLVAEGAPSPFAPGDAYRLVRFAVKARAIDARDRKPANLTFVVDVSGSMSQENRLGLVKRALGLLLDELGGDDRVALVVYGTQGRVLLRHTRDHQAIREAIDALRPEGSTNAEEGLRFGYDLADEAWRRESINRVILCSDGVANVGATGPESILARIGEEARRGIELTTVGFGMGNYNDALMEQLADQGDGAYHYVDTLDEARRIFVENLTGTLQTVARDAKVQVEFDPKVVDRWRLLGYENRDVADRDFRNDAVDAGEIGVGHSAVALYEVRLRDGARGGDPIATLHLRWKSRATKRVEEAALTLDVADLEQSFRTASPNLRTAAVAAELAERLRRSFWAKEGSWSDLVRAAERDTPARGRDTTGLAELVRRAARLAGELGSEPKPERQRRDRERLEEE